MVRAPTKPCETRHHTVVGSAVRYTVHGISRRGAMLGLY